jgi:hypothetical protein
MKVELDNLLNELEDEDDNNRIINKSVMSRKEI